MISHAHGDHAIGGNLDVYCTEATALFMKHRYRKFAAGEFHLKIYYEVFKLNGVRMSFIPAGHILGSAQVLMEYSGVRYLYTGDYKLQPDNTCEPIEFVDCRCADHRNYFCRSRYPASHTRKQEILKLNSTQTNIMLGAYALGKCQRLIQSDQ